MLITHYSNRTRHLHLAINIYSLDSLYTNTIRLVGNYYDNLKICLLYVIRSFIIIIFVKSLPSYFPVLDQEV